MDKTQADILIMLQLAIEYVEDGKYKDAEIVLEVASDWCHNAYTNQSNARFASDLEKGLIA